jgi:hypothetical protein
MTFFPNTLFLFLYAVAVFRQLVAFYRELESIGVESGVRRFLKTLLGNRLALMSVILFVGSGIK